MIWSLDFPQDYGTLVMIFPNSTANLPFHGELPVRYILVMNFRDSAMVSDVE